MTDKLIISMTIWIYRFAQRSQNYFFSYFLNSSLCWKTAKLFFQLPLEFITPLINHKFIFSINHWIHHFAEGLQKLFYFIIPKKKMKIKHLRYFIKYYDHITIHVQKFFISSQKHQKICKMLFYTNPIFLSKDS